MMHKKYFITVLLTIGLASILYIAQRESFKKFDDSKHKNNPDWVGYTIAHHPRTEGIQGPISLKYLSSLVPSQPIIVFNGNTEQEKNIHENWPNSTFIKITANDPLFELNKADINTIDLLWLDSGGTELSFLKKLKPILGKTKFIYSKVHLIAENKSYSLYQSVRKFLESEGFRAIREDLPWKNTGYVLFQQKHAHSPYASQPGIQQDKILNEKVFKNKRNGFFVDIGAHDGVTHSNTYFFEKHLGWNGICFEPLPNAYRQLKHTRNCTCINACVSEQKGEVEFIEVTGGPEMLSGMVHTYDPRHLERMKHEIKRDGGDYKISKVPSVSFNDAMQQCSVTTIDFISIDTEGAELEILQSIDFKKFNIHVITVENNYKDPAIKSYMESQGFTYVPFFSGQDEVYINSKFNKQ